MCLRVSYKKKLCGVGSDPLVCGADPDPDLHQNVTDPQH
jgi:hypothetical protein